MSTFANWIIKQHQDTNHLYDEYIPYEFHLKMCVTIGKKFKYLIPTFSNYINTNWFLEGGVKEEQFGLAHQEYYDLVVWNAIENALYAHDAIEDTRTSYNDILKKSNKYVAELVFALTDEKGRNRKERHSERYYGALKSIPGGVFCKMCDRIANVQYGFITDNQQKQEMYRKELDEFKSKLYVSELAPMFDYLEELLKQ